MNKKKFFLKDTISATADSAIKDALKSAVVFDISNIQVPLDTDFLELMANLAVIAPYSKVWIHIDKIPSMSSLKEQLEFGALVTQNRAEAGWKLRIQPFELLVGFGVQAYSALAVFALGKDGTVNKFNILDDSPIVDYFTNPICETGSFREPPLNPMEMEFLAQKSLTDPDKRREFGEGMSKIAFSAIINLSLFALALLNTKNVEMVDSHASGFSRSKRRNRHKGHRHYTLRIRPSGRRLASGSQHTGDKNSFHIARGHFKTYTKENPLFGQHVGTYWWEAHARGSKDRGGITKDYKITRKEQAE